ncbi:hypothetical protein ACWCP8_06695 [Streptomyces sp. NPDC002206]
MTALFDEAGRTWLLNGTGSVSAALFLAGRGRQGGRRGRGVAVPRFRPLLRAGHSAAPRPRTECVNGDGTPGHVIDGGGHGDRFHSADLDPDGTRSRRVRDTWWRYLRAKRRKRLRHRAR